MLLEIGNWAYQTGALGLIAFTVLFLVAVRWWTDVLGRVFAAVLLSVSGLLVLGVIRMLNPDVGQTFFAWRAVMLWSFALAVWSALISMVWAQFFAPRMKADRMTTRKEYSHESEADLASDRRDPDGGAHDRSGRLH